MDDLHGKRIRFVGKLGSLSRQEAYQLVRHRGAVVVENPSLPVDIIVVGADELPLDASGDLISEAERQAVAQGQLQLIPEIELCHRPEMSESEDGESKWYTPAMLADLLNVPVATVRRWHRRKLITPVREIKRLPYFDYQEVASARRLTQLLAESASPKTLEKKLASLERPLSQLSIVVEGNQILLRQGEELIEPGGQLRIDFDSLESNDDHTAVTISLEERSNDLDSMDPERLLDYAAELEDEEELEAAANVLRAVMAMSGGQPELCFRLAELLYRMNDLTGARERYYEAIELDTDYVEARDNLGCVLVELDDLDLAEAAFRGALAIHPEYADAHYHLAKLLEDQGDESAVEHWQEFLRLAPDSPWADSARHRLE